MPDGWTEMTLGDMAEGNPETTKGMPPQQHIRYIDLSAVSADSGIDESAVIDYELHSAPGRARRVVRHGDVLVSTVRPYLRGFAVVPESLDGAVASTGFTVLRARRELSLPGFVWSIVSKADFADRLMERATGSNYPAVRPNDIAEQVVLLPPLVVQRRVVDLVDAVDTYAAAARMLASSSESLIEALESEVMDSGEHHRALGEVTQFAGGYAFSPDRQGNNEGDLPFYKVSDMNAPENQHTMTVAANYVSDEVLSEMRAKAWPAGTVVFPKVGAALLTEKRRLLGTRAAFDNNVMGLVYGLHANGALHVSNAAPE